MSANYKDTLLLPKTDFPMKADLVKREPERLARWDADDLYGKILAARKGAPLFVLHDGPPFANGDVHMGTALNKILKDLIVKSRTMLGYRAPFVPGWDCHGLPIEFKVVRESRGLAPAEVRRRAEEFARKYIDIQRRQFKRLGVLGSWQEPYLTLAPAYEAEILRAFGAFVEKGLVYQSRKPVYWSTGAQTALAEAEVEYAQRTDPAVYVKFPVGETSGVWSGAHAVIWTTTPWTLPANVAIAVQPRARYALLLVQGAERQERVVVAEALIAGFLADTGLSIVEKLAEFTGEEFAGREAQHPFLDRKSLVIAADFVTMDTGTGQVHIAPGHGKDDYLAEQQHGLPVLSPVDDYGKFTAECGVPEWTGKYVFDANPLIIEHLRQSGALLAERPYVHDYPHCWRSKTPIVFRAVEQFFIRVDAIRADALKAIEEAAWIPAWGRSRIAGTVEARPDWCISRQRTWGVPLPIFYTADGEPILDGSIARRVADIVEGKGTNLWFENDDAWWAAELGLPAGTLRRNDTLDVWIDSGVSHQAVTKVHPELAASGGVADVYIEATDQHRGWFQSSLMTSVALTGRAPYRTVITHGFVVDKDTKKKLSKSQQGAYQKPTEAEFFVNKYGADIVRLWAASTQFTDDVPFSEENFTRISETYRGFRNVLRILLANLHDFDSAQASIEGATTIDRWILARLRAVVQRCRTAYEQYDFRDVFETVNQFCTVDLSALYVDITKDRMYCDAPTSPRRRAAQTVMHRCFETVAKLLAPILAFTADEAWEFAGNRTSVHIETFPAAERDPGDEALLARVEQWLKVRAMIYQQAIEPARQQKVLAKSLEGTVTVALPEAARADFDAAPWELEEFFIVSGLAFETAPEPAARVVRSAEQQCPRCWRHLPLTARGVCERCDSALA
jgi:isoleucyl-tRNA synthetase